MLWKFFSFNKVGNKITNNKDENMKAKHNKSNSWNNKNLDNYTLFKYWRKWEVLTVHCSELRLFLAKAFPLL